MYSVLHAEKIKQYKKNYNETNKEKIKEYKKIVVTCECGVSILKTNLSQHLKSKKHINLMNNN